MTNRPAAVLLAATLAALAFGTACTKGDGAGPAPAPAPAMAGGPKVVPETAYKPALVPYEELRAALAADQLAGATAAAAKVEVAAQQLAGADAAKKPHYDEMTAAAAKLKGAADLDAARLAFGELSKPVVALLAADPAAQKGYVVMECPMVKGFQKWVQLGDRIENPYMGRKMLECGGPSTWGV